MFGSSAIYAISLASYLSVDQMGDGKVRTGFTSRGFCALSPWNQSNAIYSAGMINLGNNFYTKLEIVSALNSFNTARCEYHLNYTNCAAKYNPKLYLGTVQSVAYGWNYDYQNGQKTTYQGCL